MSAITTGWLYLGWGVVLFETYYGLMQHSPSEIKEKLLKALDKEYNVVDMAAVLEIVTILERTPITKEALETTRLGRDINELRRKTKNESLAKRAKDLVRRWRHLILPQNETSTDGQQNGGSAGRASNRGAMHRTQHPISPAISLANSDKSNVSPVLPTRVEAVPKTHVANKRLRKEGNQEAGETSPDTQPVAKRAKPEAQKLNGDHYDSVGSDCEIVSVTPARPRNRKKAPKDRTDVTGEDIVKEKLASIARIPKVKTTQELLADLRSRSSETPSNCVLPVVDHDVARNKTEHIARFLRSQGDEEDEVIEVVHTEETSAAPSEVESKEEKPTLESPEEILARLPPLDLDSINWDESPLPSPTPHQVTDEDVDRVLNQHIEGINGNRDEKDKDSDVFCEWHQVVSRTSYQGDLLHILPYVVID